MATKRDTKWRVLMSVEFESEMTEAQVRSHIRSRLGPRSTSIADCDPVDHVLDPVVPKPQPKKYEIKLWDGAKYEIVGNITHAREKARELLMPWCEEKQGDRVAFARWTNEGTTAVVVNSVGEPTDARAVIVLVTM